MALAIAFLDPTAATLASGATASASGITSPAPVRVGIPAVGQSGTPFNLAADVDCDELGNAYVVDLSNSRLRKFDETGTEVDFAVIGSQCYGVAVDTTAQRVYVTWDNAPSPSVRYYDYNLNELGSFLITQGSHGIEVLPNGNVLVMSDSGPSPEIREYTGAGVFVATWHTGTGSNRLIRGRHDGTYLYASRYSTYNGTDRAVTRFRLSDRANLGSHMPGTFSVATGAQDLPWAAGGNSKVADFNVHVAGTVDGKLIYIAAMYETGYGIYEADPATGTFERMVAGRTGDIGSFSVYYNAYLMGCTVSANKVWLAGYSQHTLTGWDHRTATAQYSAVSAGTRLRRVLVKGFDARKVKVQYRLNAGAWTDVTPNDSVVLNAGAGIDLTGQVLDFRVSLNTWRGFNLSDTTGPLDKAPPVVQLGFEYNDGVIEPTQPELRGRIGAIASLRGRAE